MAEANRAEAIRQIFAAYLANDREFVENAFSEGFRFTSPYDDNIDKPAYFERCWKNSDWIERHELEKIFVKAMKHLSPTVASPKAAGHFAIPNSSSSMATR